MLIRYEDLTSLDMEATDGSTHSVEDIFVTDGDLRAVYVVADTGGWFSGRKAMVSIERFGAPDVGASRWKATIAEEELEDKPAPADRGDAAGDRGQARELPGAMLGPFGGVAAPGLLYGRAGSGEALPIPPKADPRHRAPAGTRVRSVGELIESTDVAAEDGAAGKLMGMIFETDDWKATHLIIETGGEGLPQNQRVVPVDLLESIDWDGRAVRLRGTVGHIQNSPDLHEMDGLAGKWYNKVLAYYGMQS